MKQTRELKRVHELMTCPVTAAPADASLERVAELLADGHMGAVPVADPDGLLLGMVTEGDLLRDCGPRAPVAAAVMSAPLVTVGVDQTLSEAQALMIRHRIYHLPVVDRAGRLVGMINRDGVAIALGEDEAEVRSAIAGVVHACAGSIVARGVRAGVVRLHARVADAQAARAVEQRVDVIPGVRVLIPMMECRGEVSGYARADRADADRR
jgi:CBS domain-containing protein